MITIKTQAEWDALPPALAEYTTIEIRSDPAIWLRITAAPKNSHVEAWGASHVVARGMVCVHQRSSIAPALYAQSTCYVYAGFANPVSKSDRCFVIPVKRLTRSGGWLEEEGVAEDGGFVVLFKRVSKDWLTQVVILFLATALSAQSRLDNWRISAIFFTGASAMDAVSSRGQYELNPALGRGPFGARQEAVKGIAVGGILLTEYLVLRKHPETRRSWVYVNYAAGAATAGAAIHNWRQK